MMRVPSWSRRGCATVAGLLAAAVLPTAPVGASGPTVSFTVVEPDGSRVVRPYVMVSVIGQATAETRQSRGSATGLVTVAVPVDDPVVASRLADGRFVNLMIRVFDKAPGSAGINAVYVATAAAGPVLAGVPAPASDVQGQVLTLQPGRTAFGENQASFDDNAGPPDEPDCPGDAGWRRGRA